MRDLINCPIWEAHELGTPIPDSPHAVSVAMPLWEHVVRYEECDPDLLEALQCGYPRFFVHPSTRKLFAQASARFAKAEESTVAFPSHQIAERAQAYLQHQAPGVSSTLDELGSHGIWCLTFPESSTSIVMNYWRFSGEIISSRLAEAVLMGREGNGLGHGARTKLRKRLAGWTGQNAADVFLFPSGMSAVFTVNRMLNHCFPGKKSIQVQFPYVDVLKVQEQWGPGVHFHSELTPEPEIQQRLKQDSIAALYCEIPSNPLMRSVDFEALDLSIPVIIDDTIATNQNIDAFRFADVVTTSLTKFISGTSDVMAGSVIVRKDSPWHDVFTAFLNSDADDPLWADDAVILEENSRDFPERLAIVNHNAEALFEFLSNHPKVRECYYPKTSTRDRFDQIRRAGGGFGGLISIVLDDPETQSATFYDQLRVTKGPSLGTNFTLVCPYTLLAHYPELEWAEKCGVSRHLIRISVGTENTEELVDRFRAALNNL